MQHYTVYLYLETALHVSGGFSTRHQEHTQLYLQYLVLVKPLLLPAAIVKVLQLLAFIPFLQQINLIYFPVRGIFRGINNLNFRDLSL